jgi:hypothetical protein
LSKAFLGNARKNANKCGAQSEESVSALALLKR